MFVNVHTQVRDDIFFYDYTLNHQQAMKRAFSEMNDRLTVSHCSKDLENKLVGKAQAVDTKNINSIKSMIRKGSIFFFNITQ